MEPMYLPRFVPGKRKDLCIDESYASYEEKKYYKNFSHDLLLYAEEPAMREMEQLSNCNMTLQAA
eukprot:13356146-Heterocapsa_arctica.AAC.1